MFMSRVWLCVALLSTVGCTPTTSMDAGVDVRADDTPTDVETPIDAPPLDAPAGCEDVSGGYFWAIDCPSFTEVFGLPTTECLTQTGCTVTDYADSQPVQTYPVVGTTITSVGLSGPYEVTCVADYGASPTFHCEAVASGLPTLTCDATGARSRLAGASSFCCDVVAQDCSGGQRCTSYGAPSISDAARFTACVPNGTLAEDAACVRPRDIPGDDDCVAGLYCSNFEQPDAATRTCRPLCAAESDCAAGQICSVLASAPATGICRPTCTLGGADCGAGLTCRGEFRYWTTAGASEIMTACERIGGGALGAPCTNSEGCAAGLACGSVAGSSLACRLNCGPGVTCPSGETCYAWGPPATPMGTNPMGFGICGT